ncbi:MAG: hypothetical protein ABL958_14975 [Bdellovibrionia bacterium]
MKKLFCALLIVSSFSIGAFADSPGAGRLGAGIMIGEPTALTGKYWLTRNQAVDFGFGFWTYHSTIIFGDYHWYWPEIFGHKNKFVGDLSLYVGVGGGVASWRDRYWCNRWRCEATGDSGTAIFVRVPVGVEWFPGHPPLGVFVEVSPSFSISPGMSGYLDFATGIRYYF